MWTLLYENVRSVDHAKTVAFPSPSQALAKSWTWMSGRKCPGSPHNRHWLLMAAKSKPTEMLCLDASSTKLKASLVCGLPCAAPRSSFCRLATVPAVENTTQQEFRAHVRVSLQPGVFPKVSYTFSSSKDASPSGAVVRWAWSRNKGAGWSPSTLSRNTTSL